MISWTTDGDAFIIHQAKQFQDRVLLPEYFLSDANLGSFWCRKVCYVVSFVDVVACCGHDTDFVGMHGNFSCIDGAFQSVINVDVIL